MKGDLRPRKTIRVNPWMIILMSFVLFVILAVIGFATRHYSMNGGLA